MAIRVLSAASEKLGSAATSAGDWLNEQVWFQQARGKWDELDPRNRLYIQIAIAAAIIGTVITLLFAAYVNVRTLRGEVSDKRELLSVLQSASEELRQLRDSRGADTASGPWPAYFESIATGAGVDPATMTVAAEKAGTQTDLAKESLVDISLKKVSIRQVVKLAHALESGARPVKVRQLLIDTKADPEGYMDATLSVSAFAWVPQ